MSRYKGKLTKGELRAWVRARLDLVSPREDEPKDDFIGRCMGAVSGEFPDEGQRRAVCESFWDEGHGDMRKRDDDDEKKKKKGRTIYERELLAPGVWSGSLGPIEFTVADLEQLATAFDALHEVHHAPLKFGHNDEQPLTDGMPALGWLENVKIKNDRLVGDFTDVPEVVAQAIEAKLYRHVSVEIDFDVQHGGRFFPMVLSGVALLGADIPAVNTLQDLSALMARATIHGARRATLTRREEDTDVDELVKLKTQLAELQVKNAGDFSAWAREKTDLQAKIDKLEREGRERDEATKKAAFAAKRVDLTGRLDGLVKAEAITPAKREELLAKFEESDVAVDRLEFAVKTLEDLPDVAKKRATMKKVETGAASGDEEDEEKDPGRLILTRVREAMAKEPSISFADAKRRVMNADAKLARAYIESNGTYRENVERGGTA